MTLSSFESFIRDVGSQCRQADAWQPGMGPVSRSKDGSALYVIPRKARHIMRRGVLTVGPDEPVKKAAGLMARKKIGALPVINGQKLVGIVTATDLLRAFSRS